MLICVAVNSSFKMNVSRAGKYLNLKESKKILSCEEQVSKAYCPGNRKTSNSLAPPYLGDWSQLLTMLPFNNMSNWNMALAKMVYLWKSFPFLQTSELFQQWSTLKYLATCLNGWILGLSPKRHFYHLWAWIPKLCLPSRLCMCRLSLKKYYIYCNLSSTVMVFKNIVFRTKLSCVQVHA